MIPAGPAIGFIDLDATVALVREPAPSLNRCELTHLARAPIDVARAAAQHQAYVDILAGLGARIEWLPLLDDQPDGVFVEDTAVVFPEVAVLAWPGVASRQPEVASVAPALARHRPLRRIDPPAHLDGGDVLVIGHRVLVGLSSRTNEAGVAALRAALAPFGYEVEGLRLHGALHLKSACTVAGDSLVTTADIRHPWLAGLHRLEADPEEPRAANTLSLGGTTLVSARYPRTAGRLREAGVRVHVIDVSELEKAEAGLTCMSLIVTAAASGTCR